jgi:hypothetical protein
MIEFAGCPCIALCVLSSDRQVHGMSAADIAANQALVTYVFLYLSSQLLFYLQAVQWVIFVHFRLR